MLVVILGVIVLLCLWLIIEEAYNIGYRNGRVDEHLQSMGDKDDNK